MKTQYYRKRNVIRSANVNMEFDSVAEAKRESRRLQGDKLGRGLVRVVDKLPTFEEISYG